MTDFAEPSDRRPVRVFISYAHDSAEHVTSVRDFWVFLRGQGVDARLDLSAAEQRQEWSAWMLEQVRDARFVLVVASPAYKRRSDGLAAADEGRGVQFEGRLIREFIYRDQAAGVERFLPVLLPGVTVECIPDFLSPVSATSYRVSSMSVAGCEPLLRVLTGQPYEVEPLLGTVPVLAPRVAMRPDPPPSAAQPLSPLQAFCVRLKRLQAASGLTQITLANRMGVSKARISAILNGKIKRLPDWNVVQALVKECLDHAVRTGGVIPSDLRVDTDWRRRYANVERDAMDARVRQRDTRRARRMEMRRSQDLGDDGSGSGGRFEPVLVTTAPAAMRTLPADVASFTGRQDDLERVLRALPGPADTAGIVRIDAIDGMAGVGKTAFAVHAAHRLAPRFPDGQLFMRLHGHTPGQQPVDPLDALAALLRATGMPPEQIPQELDERAGLWRGWIADRKVLLLLDDAASSAQVRPLLPGTSGSLVLVTSRLRLAAIPEAMPVTLDVLDPGQAAELFVRLASRPGRVFDDAAVARVVAQCGYLPLAISLLAGQLKHRPEWTAENLALDLESASDRLAAMEAENISVAASFGLSYNNLSEDQQHFFRRLGLHPGPDIDGYAAAALNDTDLATARTLLADLFGYHLIDEPARGRYRFHDLIREHARKLAAKDPAAELAEATDRLLDYYLHTVRTANRYLARHTAARIPDVTGGPPAHAPRLPTRDDAVSWMDAEKSNLDAAFQYAATHDRPGHAIAISAAMHGYLLSQGHWDQALALHRAAVDAARRTGDEPAAASALMDLAVIELAKGNFPEATAGLMRALELFCDIGDRQGQANARSYLGVVYLQTDDYPASTASLNMALQLFRDLGDRRGKASALNRLNIVQQLTGDYRAAVNSLTAALELLRDLDDRQGEGTALSNLGLVLYLTGEYLEATAILNQAQELHRDLGDRKGQAGDLNHLGAVQRDTGNYRAANESLTQAVQLYHGLGDRLGEATALGDLGLVQARTGDQRAAAETLAQALELHRDLGNQLGIAEVLNNLGELWLASAASAKARKYYDQALQTATEITSPLEEARALEGIGRCHLQDGQSEEGATSLRKALVIYNRVGSPNAQRVQNVLPPPPIR
jgi:tetratricopeptide (TPR) repeat protein/transcriptional regulator with XRE-family HTH domain